jgi:NAD(P)H-dependent flavin oxidoreductase YrpB (nitropropane dioxygenase family)
MTPIKKPKPNIIQGGMGIGVSSWKLAREVARHGEIGVVSGTCLDTVMVRELQEGDPHNRRAAMRDYPDRDIVHEVLDEFYMEDGKSEDEPYKLLPIHRFDPTTRSQRILSLAAFSEVQMARYGHGGIVGINLMTKLKRYTPATLYGAMLAGVSIVFMGAGIPMKEARILPRLAAGDAVKLPLDVDTSMIDEPEPPYHYRFDPADLLADPPELDCPHFYPIVSTDTLARIMDRKLDDDLVDGWVVEHPAAGGHNAPPRSKEYDEDGNPVYGDRDRPDLDQIRALGDPFYLAGGYGRPEHLRNALDLGASGVQVGSLFSLARESGYAMNDKRRIIRALHEDHVEIKTDGRISPAGFPFNVIGLEDEPSAREKAESRQRICDLGYLRQPFLDEEGQVRGRCPGEPVDSYTRKGGDPEETEKRGCLCNALFANVDHPQVREDGLEPQIFTGGKRLTDLPLGSADTPYFTAKDVIEYLYGESKP